MTKSAVDPICALANLLADLVLREYLAERESDSTAKASNEKGSRPFTGMELGKGRGMFPTEKAENTNGDSTR